MQREINERFTIRLLGELMDNLANCDDADEYANNCVLRDFMSDHATEILIRLKIAE